MEGQGREILIFVSWLLVREIPYSREPYVIRSNLI